MYIVLGVLYESYIHPVTILSTLPSAGVGALLFTMSTGWLVDHFGYTPVLIIVAVLPVMGTAFLLALGGRVRRIV